MDYYVGFISGLLIVLVTCMNHINLYEASLIVEPSQNHEVLGSIQSTIIGGFPSVRKNRLGEYEYAGYTKHLEEEIIGVHGKLNSWSPAVLPGDFTTTLISIRTVYEGQVHDISAGWMVNREEFRNVHPQIFASYTINGFTTICYNYDTNCTGFVMTKRSYFTHPISRVSTYAGQQHEIDVKIIQDHTSKIWSLLIDDIDVGHWRESVMHRLDGSKSFALWGGLVFTSVLSPHPTPMGSGRLPEEGIRKASYIREVQYIKPDHTLVNPSLLQPHQTDTTRYRVSNLGYTSEGKIHFFYGGSGNRTVSLKANSSGRSY